MSKFLKLPDNLKFWKINTLVSNESGNELYKISKKDFDGTIINAYLRHISAYGDAYTDNNVAFLEDEAKFLSSISELGSQFNYIDISSNNNSSKNKYDLYIITEYLPKLSDKIKNTQYSDIDTVDFGVQMTAILELLESKSIFHGNINPDNIYVTSDGKYKLGGFSDFESKISDMSFIAPEVFRKEPADFTTDIYSLGIIMYYLCNERKIPFEDGSNDRKSAINMRFNSKNITAPSNGNEKLKSVIVIACQPENSNRWKNSSNIKNALLSIQSELPQSEKFEHSPAVIPTEPTEFEENVFEEYDYEDFKDDEKPNDNKSNSVPDVVTSGAVLGAGAVAADLIANANTSNTTEAAKSTETTQAKNEIPDDDDESGFEIAEVTETEPQSEDSDFEEEVSEEVLPENENTVSAIDDTDADIGVKDKTENTKNIENNYAIDTIADEPISNDVFEDYEVTSKKTILNNEPESKDYGDFFDDEKDTNDTTSKNVAEDVDIFSESDDNIDIQNNDDLDENYDDTADNKSKKKRNVIIITVCIVVMLAAMGFIAFCIISGINNAAQNNSTTSPSTAVETTTQLETTVQSTTAVSTTQPTTVSKIDTNVVPVVGYGYSYGKKLLEAEGFVVEIGEYRYSTIYDEGYIISQTPDGDTTAKTGTTVTLDISLGIEETEPETTQEVTQAVTKAVSSSSNSNTNNSYLFANSNSAYLSKSDVSSLSQQNLNLALNEIYARRGRIFKDSTLSAYFNSKDWYEPLYTSDEFSKKVTFNKYEQANLQLMINEQKEKGYR